MRRTRTRPGAIASAPKASAAGDVVEVDGLEMRVVATPGHTADSLSFVLPAEGAVLTGDTVLGRGTTVVAHPDGELGAYLDSLDRLRALAEAHEIGTVWPGHGPVIDDALAAIDHYIAHRRERLEQVRDAVRSLHAAARDGVPSTMSPCLARWSRSCTPTSTRSSGEPPSSPSAPSSPISPVVELSAAANHVTRCSLGFASVRTLRKP